MKGNKTYRHQNNPLEKKIHDKFIKAFCVGRGNSLGQICLETDERGIPTSKLSAREKKIIISTIQWLGSPVGQSFLKDCGFGLSLTYDELVKEGILRDPDNASFIKNLKEKLRKEVK